MKNAIVMMFDSLSYRYINCYGNEWIKTPNFDRLAKEGVLFENCFIEGLPTIPCRRAMHTGRYTLPVKGWSALDLEDTTIADICWAHPIDTALIFDCPMYRLPKFGYTRGFDKVYFVRGHGGDLYYSQDQMIKYKAEDYHEQHIIDNADEKMGEKIIAHTLSMTENTLRSRQMWRSPEDRFVVRTMKKAVEYLEQVDRSHPFFLWVDHFDPHEPWDAPSVWDKTLKCPYNPDYKGKDQFSPIMGPAFLYSEEELHHIRMLYAELVTLCDTWLGYFLDKMYYLGLNEDTLLMVVSDHGEPLGHAEHGHGILCKCRPWSYDELCHAPMFLKGPGIKSGQRIKAYVQSVDVAPTICDWLGFGVHPNMQGKSLLPLVTGEVEKVRDFAIAGYHKYCWTLYNDDWSYIHWLKDDEKTYAASLYAIAGEGMDKTSDFLKTAGGESMMAEYKKISDETDSQTEDSLKWDNHSLDEEDTWTCGHNSKAEVPERDELYNRRIDPYQLNNVIQENQETASQLLRTLKEFMGQIVVS